MSNKTYTTLALSLLLSFGGATEGGAKNHPDCTTLKQKFQENLKEVQCLAEEPFSKSADIRPNNRTSEEQTSRVGMPSLVVDVDSPIEGLELADKSTEVAQVCIELLGESFGNFNKGKVASPISNGAWSLKVLRAQLLEGGAAKFQRFCRAAAKSPGLMALFGVVTVGGGAYMASWAYSSTPGRDPVEDYVRLKLKDQNLNNTEINTVSKLFEEIAILDDMAKVIRSVNQIPCGNSEDTNTWLLMVLNAFVSEQLQNACN